MGSRAHATMLAAQKLITYEDLDAILKGIDEVSDRRGFASAAARGHCCVVGWIPGGGSGVHFGLTPLTAAHRCCQLPAECCLWSSLTLSRRMENATMAQVEAEIEAGTFEWRSDREDVHMNVESALIDKIGEPGKKLHTARSRNDQVITDVRLWTRDAIDEVGFWLKEAQRALHALAEANIDVVVPGYACRRLTIHGIKPTAIHKEERRGAGI
jgi:hypothetical protein